VPGQAPTVYAAGFTCISGVTFDEQGRLVVLQMTTDANPDPFDATQTGALVRIEPDGQRTTLASTGLLNAGGLAYAGHGTYYVTTKTAGADGTGQLLKLQVND
jgi:sugar lactone lactonase YvrE